MERQGSVSPFFCTIKAHTFLTVRNIFVVIAGGLFILSMLHIEPIYHYWNVLKFVAYILGAGAYGAEVIVLTDGWRKNPGLKEMLMPYMFVNNSLAALGVVVLCARRLFFRRVLWVVFPVILHLSSENIK